MARPAVRSYANLAAMPAASVSSPDGSVAFSQADGGFAERVAGVWTLISSFPAGTVDGSKLADVADDQSVGGIPVVHPIAVPNGGSQDIDVVLTDKTRITDVTVIKRGGAGGMNDSIQAKNVALAGNISDAISINDMDNTVSRAAEINDAYWEIQAGGTLRISLTSGGFGNTQCLVLCHGYRVA
jgi:hypothetical protein